MTLISVFRRRLDGFACRVHKFKNGYRVSTDKGELVDLKHTEAQAAEVARRIAQGGREKWEKNRLPAQ